MRSCLVAVLVGCFFFFFSSVCITVLQDLVVESPLRCFHTASGYSMKLGGKKQGICSSTVSKSTH